MKKIQLATISTAITLLLAGIYMDKIFIYFETKSIISKIFIIIGIIAALIPFIFVEELYETTSESHDRWEKGMWFWKSRGTKKRTQLTAYRVVNLFGLFPVTTPIPIKTVYSDDLGSDSELNYDRIKTFVDFIASLIPVFGGWYSMLKRRR